MGERGPHEFGALRRRDARVPGLKFQTRMFHNSASSLPDAIKELEHTLFLLLPSPYSLREEAVILGPVYNIDKGQQEQLLGKVSLCSSIPARS